MLLAIISIIALVVFGIMGNALCRYRGKYHEYRDQYNKCHAQYKKCNELANVVQERLEKTNTIVANIGYVLSCYGDPYIVDFKDIIKHPKVSIILPVYNKGWCVEAALRSLQRQTLKEIEIICVDDGSTDNSIAKIKNYQQHDTRIKLVENGKNRGLVYTRVHGIREATGDYIMFLDPDDLYATNDIVEVAYNKCVENDVDVVCFGAYMLRRESLHVTPLCENIETSKVYSDKDLFWTNIERYCWDKFAKRECWLAALNIIPSDVIEKHVRHAEDWLLSHALSRCIKKYMHINKSGYFYNLNTQSACVQPWKIFDRAVKHANDILVVHNQILALSPCLQDFLIQHFRCWIKGHDILGPYTDDQLQQLYDIYMQINFDDEHKAKLSKCLRDGIVEIRKLRDGAPRG